MADEELNLALAEALAADSLSLEEYSAITPEVPMSAGMVAIETPESVSAIEVATDESGLVLQEVEPEVAQPDPGNFDIVEEPAPKEGLIKRWTRKIVGWVKRVFKWGKKQSRVQ